MRPRESSDDQGETGPESRVLWGGFVCFNTLKPFFSLLH